MADSIHSTVERLQQASLYETAVEAHEQFDQLVDMLRVLEALVEPDIHSDCSRARAIAYHGLAIATKLETTEEALGELFAELRVWDHDADDRPAA